MADQPRLAFTLAGLLLLGNVAGVSPTATAPAETVPMVRLEQEKMRADRAELDRAISDAINKVQASQSNFALATIAAMIALLGGLITFIVIFFALRTERAAVAAARKELESDRTQIEKLRIDAQAAEKVAEEAAIKAAEAVATAEITAVKAAEALDKAAKAAAAVASEHEKVRLASAAVTKAQSEAEAIVETLKASGEKQPVLTEAQTATLKEAADEIAEIPEKDWTVGQFKSAIGKAMYVDRNWLEASRLAQAMAHIHHEERDALVYALNRNGDAKIEMNDYLGALECYDRVIEELGPAPNLVLQQDLMWAMHHRGYALNMAGRSIEAETVLRKLLPLCEEVDGPENSGTLVTRNVLIASVLDQGRYAEAEAMLRELLPLSEKVDGPESDGTLSVFHMLAQAASEQGRAAEAETILRKLLAIREKVEGPESSKTLNTRHDLGYVLLDQGRAAEAEAMFRELLPIREKVDGSENRKTLNTRHELARALLDQGRAVEAETMFRELLPVSEKVDGPKNRDTLSTRHALGRAVLQQGRAAEAEIMFRELLPLVEEVEGSESSRSVVVRYSLAESLVLLGRPEESLEVLEAIPDLANSSDRAPLRAGRLAFVQALVFDALGRTEEASELIEKAAHQFAVLPPDHYFKRRLDSYTASRPSSALPNA